MKPSSRPIRSSWSRWPRLEKNRLPGDQLEVVPPTLLVGQPHPLPGPQRSPVDARPGAAVRAQGQSCRLSAPPGRRGRRRRWPARRTPTRRPRRRRYSVGRLAADRQRSGPRRRCRPGSASPSSRVRATVETGDPGAPVLGGGEQRGLVDDADRGRRRLVTVTMLPASASWARRTASASGRSAGTERVRRARARPTRCGSLRRSRRRRHRRGGAGPQERPDHEGQHEVDDGRRGRRTAAPGAAATASSATAASAAAPAGDQGAAVHVAGDPPHQRLQHPAAVERQPRDEVEHADEQVGDRPVPRPPSRSRPSGTTSRAPPASPGRPPIEVSGPTTAMKNSWRGVRASPSIAVIAAEEVQRDRGDREPVVRWPSRVRRLVQQHREVEQDREGQADDVLPGTQAGLDLLHPRRDRDGEQAGDQEPGPGDEHVGARRCVPMRSVPGGAAGRSGGSAGAPGPGSVLATARGYRRRPGTAAGSVRARRLG